jgi:hypothetical protein
MKMDMILDKILIRQKNIIFFKTIIYIGLISLVAILLILSQEDLSKSIDDLQKAQIALDQTYAKLDAINNFEKEVLSKQKIYKKLLKKSNQSMCTIYTNIFKQFNSIPKKLSLNEPINIEIIRKFSDTNLKTSHTNIKTEHYNTTLEFNSADINSLLAVLTEINKTIPSGSIATNINIQTKTPVTPRIISQLKTQTLPALINTQMQLELQEIVYEK